MQKRKCTRCEKDCRAFEVISPPTFVKTSVRQAETQRNTLRQSYFLTGQAEINSILQIQKPNFLLLIKINIENFVFSATLQ